MVKLLPCDLKVTSSSHGNSFLQSKLRLHTIDASPRPTLAGALYTRLSFYDM